MEVQLKTYLQSNLVPINLSPGCVCTAQASLMQSICATPIYTVAIGSPAVKITPAAKCTFDNNRFNYIPFFVCKPVNGFFPRSECGRL
jgi:hypothetical protein